MRLFKQGIILGQLNNIEIIEKTNVTRGFLF